MTGILLLFGERVSSFILNDGAVFIFGENHARAPPYSSEINLGANDLQKKEVEYVHYQFRWYKNSSVKECV